MTYGISMYDVGDSLPINEIEPGTYVLAGPAMSGKYDLLLDIIVDGLTQDEGSLFVSTNDDAESIFEGIQDRYDQSLDLLRMVDCVSERQMGHGQFPQERVEYVNSPADLTGLGIDVSEQLRQFAEGEVQLTRIAFHSVSTLLMYSELETVFRFLHVLTGRVDSVDGLGFFSLDPTTHDEGDVNTIKQLFDGMVEVRSVNTGRQVRFVGIEGAPEGWIDHS